MNMNHYIMTHVALYYKIHVHDILQQNNQTITILTSEPDFTILSMLLVAL